MKKDLFFLPVLLLLLMIYCTGIVHGSFQDQERAINNNFSAWNDSLWVQTTLADFNNGTATSVTVKSPGNVTLMASPSGGGGHGVTYSPLTGSIASQVLNTGIYNATWDALIWYKMLPSNSTNITFYVRANNSQFFMNNTVINWTLVGATSPVMSGLPKGQYLQWRANLSTTDKSATPDLQEVRVWYH